MTTNPQQLSFGEDWYICAIVERPGGDYCASCGVFFAVGSDGPSIHLRSHPGNLCCRCQGAAPAQLHYHFARIRMGLSRLHRSPYRRAMERPPH